MPEPPAHALPPAVDATSPPFPADLQQRLTPLCDGRPGLRGCLPAEVREPGDAAGQPIIEFISSDESLDRYDEVILASGWRLDNYRRNPVFQNAHRYADVLCTLGKALQTEVREGKLHQRVLFATDVNPIARIAYGLYRGRFLNAVSVGFIPLRWEDGSASPGRHADASQPVWRRRYLEQELLEVSAVSIPANPNALQLACAAGAVQAEDLDELLELVRVARPPQPRAPATHGFAELLSLARQLKRLMRRS